METREKILVIDDEESTLRLFDLYLKIFGYEALLASSGEQGLKLFQEYLPDIVLTDLKMPGIDGMVVLREIKKIKPDTEVIVITGHGDVELAVKALNLDATDFLNKPIGKEDIEKSLKRAKERLLIAREQKNNFHYEVEREEARVYLDGSVDGNTYRFLENIWTELSELPLTKVRFYFSTRVSINGAGISLFSKIGKEAKEKKIALEFINLPAHFKQVFQKINLI
ncbi:MAG: hypothetical protein PWR24_1285 [Desulfonauticus sp.]|jgi:YesN/AraC family two-component response regulator|nr:MAG: Anti-sigma-factor antagonist [Desulfonauticus sp. 38_4375]MDK2921728.1 hypothetical protein [Desulfonauticus sp.]